MHGRYYSRARLRRFYAHQKDDQQHYHHIDRLHKTVTTVQYVLAAIMVLVILQIVVTSEYYVYFLITSVTVSYGLAAFLVGVLAYSLFSWYRINKSLVILLYALAYCIVVVNAIDSLVFFDSVLLGTASTIITAATVSPPLSNVTFQGLTSGTITTITTMPLLPLVQINSLISYFILTWAATIILLIHNVKRRGRLKLWILIAAPSVYLISYYLSQASQITMSIFSSGVVTGALIAVSFWSMSRSVSQKSHVRDYMVITAYGFIIFYCWQCYCYTSRLSTIWTCQCFICRAGCIFDSNWSLSISNIYCTRC
jgi:hypothetical protein